MNEPTIQERRSIEESITNRFKNNSFVKKWILKNKEVHNRGNDHLSTDTWHSIFADSN